VADLFGKERRVRPGLPQDLAGREVAVRVVEQELQELKLPFGEAQLVTFVTYEPPRRIEPEALQLPDAPVPEVKTYLVALHLVFDDREVGGGGCLSGWRELGDIAADPVQDSPLELEQVGVDAHPVAGIFP